MSKDICRLEPVGRATEDTLLAPTTLRFYRSSKEGMVSVSMFLTEDTSMGRYVMGGTRLTRAQVEELRDELSAYLAETKEEAA